MSFTPKLKKENKRSLAVIGVGMVGGGPLDQGIPAMVKGLIKLQELYSITLYSCIPVNKDNAPKGMRLRCISDKRIPLKLKYMYLIFLFMKDHAVKKYTLIHAQSPYPAGTIAFWLNRLLRIPWVLSLHAGETVSLPNVPFGDLLNDHLKRAAFKVCERADLVMAMSDFQANITRRNLKLDKEIHVLPRGIDVVSPLKYKQLTSPVKLLHISNYHPVKDYTTLLHTLAIIVKHTPAELTIAGDGYTDQLKQLITSLQLEANVVLMGAVPNEQLHKLFRVSHILLHTSHYEALAMVALEAMAEGVLVCGTHVGIMADLSGDCCITVPPGEYEQLANEVLKILDDEPRYKQICKQAYEKVKGLDLQWYVTQLDLLYSKIA